MNDVDRDMHLGESKTPYVFDTAQDDAELARLRAIEAIFDESSRRCLLATGLGAGWNCLEVGAGAGSIAAWLAEAVGGSGRVVALDVNPRFLSRLTVPPHLEIVAADIREALLRPASFDLVHTRFVLIHVPDWEAALDAMVAALKPGGWLVLEEPDFSASRSFAGKTDLRRAFDAVHQAVEAMFLRRGMDPAWGARIPHLLEERGFEGVSIRYDAPIVCGDSPRARMMARSTAALADKYVETGLASRNDIDLYGQFASDSKCWATYHATIGGIGRKP